MQIYEAALPPWEALGLLQTALCSQLARAALPKDLTPTPERSLCNHDGVTQQQ